MLNNLTNLIAFTEFLEQVHKTAHPTHISFNTPPGVFKTHHLCALDSARLIRRDFPNLEKELELLRLKIQKDEIDEKIFQLQRDLK